MLRRLGLGALKGLLTGAVIGAAFHFGLGWTTAAGLLGFLIAMGVGSTTAAITGKPPWRHAAWIEGVLKSSAGLAIGAFLFWVLGQVTLELPIALPDVPEGSRVSELPLLFAPAIASVVGALIELDNTKL